MRWSGRHDSLPPIEIGCCRFRSVYRVAETRVHAVSAGGGLGWGAGGCGNVVPSPTTPTPNPSPQGGGEKFAAPLRLRLAPMAGATIAHRLALASWRRVHMIAADPVKFRMM